MSAAPPGADDPDVTTAAAEVERWIARVFAPRPGEQAAALIAGLEAALARYHAAAGLAGPDA